MEQRVDYYTLVGFSSETENPESLDTLTIAPDKTAILLDFDGTFIDIAETPDAVSVDAGDKQLLEELIRAHAGAVAMVSGRNLKDIDFHLAGVSGTVSGGHGAELRHAGETFPGFPCDAGRLDHLKAAVKEFAMLDPRVLAEDKSFGIVLHYRQHPELEGKVTDFLKGLVEGDDEFELQFAKMAVEVKPKAVSKASAIERIMQFDAFRGRGILYAGDDVTDEAAFAWVNERGGVSIKVGDGPTIARYRTDGPRSLKTWLRSQIRAARPGA